MERSLVKMKTADQTNFNTEKAEAESLLRKAKLFYGDNKKVQMLVFDLENKINELTKFHRRKALAGNTVYYIIQAILAVFTISTIWFGFGFVFLGLMFLYYCFHNKKFIFAN